MNVFDAGTFQHPPLYFTDNQGKLYPSFVSDLSGRLIICNGTADKNSPIPYASHWMNYTYSYLYPLIWELRTETIEGKVESLGSVNGKTNQILKGVYPKGKVKKFPHLFFPIKGAIPPTSSIEKCIGMINSDISHENKQKIISKLDEVGVYPIPEISRFDARYHQVKGGGMITGDMHTVKAGWASHHKVYVKTTVG